MSLLDSRIAPAYRRGTFIYGDDGTLLNQKDIPLALYLCMLVLFSTGVITNGLCVIAFAKIKIPSRLSKFLSIAIHVSSSLTCLVGIVGLHPKESFWTGIRAMDSMMCILYYSMFGFFAVYTTNTCIIVCMSLDRFWAVVYMHSYRANSTRYILCCSLYILLYPGLANIMSVFRVQYDGKSCQTHGQFSDEVAVVFDLILSYLVPAVIIVVANMVIFQKLKQSRVGLSANTAAPSTTVTVEGDDAPPSSSSGTNTTGASEISENAAGQQKLPDAIARNLYISVLGFSIGMAIIEIPGFIVSVLDITGVLKKTGWSGLTFWYYLFMCTCFACVIPVIQLLSIKTLKECALKVLARVRKSVTPPAKGTQATAVSRTAD